MRLVFMGAFYVALEVPVLVAEDGAVLLLPRGLVQRYRPLLYNVCVNNASLVGRNMLMWRVETIND
jgi:hypothetical protein